VTRRKAPHHQRMTQATLRPGQLTAGIRDTWALSVMSQVLWFLRVPRRVSRVSPDFGRVSPSHLGPGFVLAAWFNLSGEAHLFF